MKMNDVYTKPMKQLLEEDCDVIEQKVHTDKDGNVMAIEIKYRPKDTVGNDRSVEIPDFMHGGHARR